MGRNFKIVKPDKNNSDEYLVGFFETEMQAQSACKLMVRETFRNLYVFYPA